MTTADGVLWALAAVLLGAALIVQAGQERPWDAAAFFAAALAALRSAAGLAPVPLRGGPIPAEGWDGDVSGLDDDLGPSMRLGPGLDWVGLSGPDALTVIGRRTADVMLVWFEAPKVRIDGLRTEVIDMDAFDQARALASLAPLVERPECRLVLAAHAHADELLRMLAEAPGLRDRLRAVLLVGSRLDPGWVADHFTHLAFDVEVQRDVPYVTLRLPGSFELRTPPPPPTARTSIAVVDLGEIEPDALADASTARALGALLAAIG